MDLFNASPGMLDLVSCPAFSVIDGLVEYTNSYAQSLCINEGTPVAQLILTGREEYEAMDSGSLSLTVSVNNNKFGSFVNRIGNRDIFLLDQQEEDPRQTALALASVSLRQSLSEIMAAAEHLSRFSHELSPEGKQRLSVLNRGTFRMLRQISNMSDAIPYAQEFPLFQMLDAKAVTDEFFEKAAAMLGCTGATLRFSGLKESIYTTVNRDKLERAIYNLLNNAVQSLEGPGNIDVRVSAQQERILITVEDDGRGMSDEALRTAFCRYQRRPSSRDISHGIGLGLSLVRSVAAMHGGTVLIQRREPKGTCVTMTLAVRLGSSSMLKSPIFPMDYAGEHDHALLELSEILPPSLYE